MKKLKKVSDEFVMSVGLLLVSFFIFQMAILPTLDRGDLSANVRLSTTIGAADKPTPGFTFNHVFTATTPGRGGASFDAAIVPFNDAKNASLVKETSGSVQPDFGAIRDAWNYPVKKNAYHSLLGAGSAKSDADANTPGLVNCRANTNVTGFFQAYFEDVALDTNAGYDDAVHGQARQDEACLVLQDIAALIMLDQTTVTPDILFMADQSIPPNALAAASAYFGFSGNSLDNGSLHLHIISQVDPTPTPGAFDAFIMTNFSVPWDVDSSLNPGTYDFYTVIYHEVMHALGFRSLLPATIATTGDEHLYGTFDAAVYKNDTLANPFFTPSGLSNIPVGAPSPWFVGNQAVYRGVENIVGATPDGVRPIFSPTPWQQGSSLSHFDMARANGDIYVMHPTLPTNTARPIEQDEKEVLCHLGYAVVGLAGCSGATPSAVDDTLLLSAAPVCIKPLQNDTSFSGGTLSLNDLAVVSIEPGDTLAYYSGTNCNLAQLPNASGAKSILFTPANTPNARALSYTNKDSVSNRISLPANIALVSCTSDAEEYVCNGDFEMEPVTTYNNYIGKFYCGTSYDAGYSIPFWCGELSSDFVNHTSTPTGFWYDLPYDCSSIYAGCNVDTPDGSESAAFMTQNPAWRESMVTKLKQPLDTGTTYRLTFDIFGLAYAPLPNQMRIQAYIDDGIDTAYLSPNQNTLAFSQQLLNQSITFNQNSNWTQVSVDFVPNMAADALLLIPNTLGFGNYVGNYYVDNVSIREVPPGDNAISGTLFEDQNGNGSRDAGEPGLPGVEIGLFEQGNATPLATTTTNDIPDQGEYLFTGVADGSYFVAPVFENIFSGFTEPSANPNQVPGHTYVRSVSVSNGDTEDEEDFGVVLANPNVEPVPLDIKISKELIDKTLSVFDRTITWRVRVANLGPNNATNIIVSDLIPAGLLYESHTTQNLQESYTPATGAYVIPNLPAGAQTQIDIVMKVPQAACGTKTNTASLASLGQLDTDPSNNQSSVAIKLKACNAAQVR